MITSTTTVYKPTRQGPLELRVCSPQQNRQKERPAIVFFFGGGWRMFNPGQFLPQCQHYAELGMVAIAADYRVEEKHGTTPFESVQDGKSAIRWVRRHASEFSVDPNRIVASGGSAGGHVAACTALIPEHNDPEDDRTISARPNALLLFNPALDLTYFKRHLERLGERAREISPQQHVVSGLPPTAIFHGRADETVPFAQTEQFQKAMQELGNICHVYGYDAEGHGFFNHGRTAYESVLSDADATLASWGYIAF
ncbi:alpha/beta hydrolase [Chloroflexi bacterium TSY]|nr:alpha/beta hydrolase [Chloroflexi bacterium TSY]